MARRLPPLNPLRVFEAVARAENLTLAAQELHVSQSAVSRQVATLENYLGVELFRRERHGVSLTQTGRAYARQIIPAFEALSQATEKLLDEHTTGVLKVRTYTTFTAKWLIPRLPDFRARHPDIEIVISNGVREVDFDRDQVDLAIQFGNGSWSRTTVDLLFEDQIEPVCSPQFAERAQGTTKDLDDLLTERLLVSYYRRTDWEDWLAATGRTEVAANVERMSFSTSVLTWQAALDGLGIAIGQTAMLQEEFASGRLIRPFQAPVVRPDMGHYLVRPAAQRYSRKVEVFTDWALSAIGDGPSPQA
ncbi:MAG: transcriptional regulator GcvA [Burkholderiaceae bacterium]